jgi:hypothetical protein
VSALLGSPDLPAARQALARLVDVHLVGPAGTRYGLHDLVRLFAIERRPRTSPPATGRRRSTVRWPTT